MNPYILFYQIIYKSKYIKGEMCDSHINHAETSEARNVKFGIQVPIKMYILSPNVCLS